MVKIPFLLKNLLFMVGFVFVSFSAVGQSVKIAELEGTYSGGQKKGLAHGKGKAVGQETYQGEFKKGYPHGKGIYTYASGDVFEGVFKKGIREGAGKLTTSKGELIEGVWINDHLAYNVTWEKGGGINRIVVRKESGDVSLVRFNRFARETDHLDRDFEAIYNDEGKEIGSKVSNVTFPFKHDMEVLFNNRYIPFQIEIFIPGTWSVEFFY